MIDLTTAINNNLKNAWSISNFETNYECDLIVRFFQNSYDYNALKIIGNKIINDITPPV